MKNVFSSKLFLLIGIVVLVLAAAGTFFYYSFTQEGGGEVPFYKSLIQSWFGAAKPELKSESEQEEEVVKNPTVNNPQADFGGTNIGDTIYFSWGPTDRVAEYVLFKSLFIQGPWEEDGRVPASLTNAVDITPDARIKTLCYRLEAQDTQGRVVRNYEPICVPPYQDESPKNPTVSNAVNDLRGSNYLEGVGLTWTPDERAAEYVIVRSDLITGPFAEIGRVPAGLDRRTNAEDITPDARTKTICYKIEARDAGEKTIRVYEPVCVPKWQEEETIKNPTINNPKVDFLGTNIGDTIYFSWGPADRAAEYVLFKSLSPPGPWEEDFRLPASAGTEGVDVTPDARIKTLCYKLEALDSQGKIVRKYEPICVPKYEE